MRTFGVFSHANAPELGIVKNYTNLVKKLLPLMDLTIIIKSLVIRINSCQN